jgi:transposase-like protein
VANALYRQNEGSMVKMEESLDERMDEDSGEEDGCSAEEEYSNSARSAGGRSYKRGPYKSYSMAEKERAVQLLLEEQLPITEISRKLLIPCKNIKRWSTQGVYRKRGGGRRRSSPHMEETVDRWIRQQYKVGEVVELDRVQEYALAISGDEYFKASRGWALKFIDRFRLRQAYTFR